MPSRGPASATRTVTPVARRSMRVETPATPAGYISSALRGLRGLMSAATPRHESHQLDRASGQASDQAQSEGDVGPALVAAAVLLERIGSPQEGIRRTRHTEAFVRMPDAARVATREVP